MKILFPLAFIIVIFLINKNNPYLFSSESAKESYFIDEVHYAHSPYEQSAYKDPYEEMPSSAAHEVESHLFEGNLGLFNHPIARPLILDDSIVIATDYGVIERRHFDGTLIWSYRLINARSGITTNIIKIKNLLFFGGMNGYLYSLNLSNGRPRWSFYLGDYVGCELATDGQNIFTCASTNRVAYRLRVASLDALTGKLNWDIYEANLAGFYQTSLKQDYISFRSYDGTSLQYDLQGNPQAKDNISSCSDSNLTLLEVDQYGHLLQSPILKEGTIYRRCDSSEIKKGLIHDLKNNVLITIPNQKKITDKFISINHSYLLTADGNDFYLRKINYE